MSQTNGPWGRAFFDRSHGSETPEWISVKEYKTMARKDHPCKTRWHCNNVSGLGDPLLDR